MKINGKEVLGTKFAYDGCHKIYIIEDDKDLMEALNFNYDIFPIGKLEDTYNKSCPLKFISNWKLNNCYVPQFEDAKFEY